jgi:hypothetical protein
MPRWRGAGVVLAGLVVLASCARTPQAATQVELTLEGGPNPGRYEVRSADAGCREGLLGPGSWMVQLTDWTGPKAGLRSLQLMVPAVDAPERFYLGLVFGDFFTGTVHEIETRAGVAEQHGAGQATVTRQADASTVAITATTKDSVAIRATIICGRMDAAATEKKG